MNPWDILARQITKLNDRMNAVPSIREATVMTSSPLAVRFDTDTVNTLVFGTLVSRLQPGDRVMTARLARYVWILGNRGGMDLSEGLAGWPNTGEVSVPPPSNNLNNATQTGFYQASSTTANSPDPSIWHNVQVVNSGSRSTQIAYPIERQGTVWKRWRLTPALPVTWSPWVKVDNETEGMMLSNCDAATTPGTYRTNSGTSNTPTGTEIGSLRVYFAGSDESSIRQEFRRIFADGSGQDLRKWVRTRSGGVWRPWVADGASDWTNIPLTAGYTAFDAPRTPKYRTEQSGTVLRLAGLVRRSAGTWTNGAQTFATLPFTLPFTQATAAAPMSASATYAAWVVGLSNGSLQAGGNGVNDYVYLDGVTFALI